MILDLDKPLQTRDGSPVTLITTKGREPWPLVGYIGDASIPSSWRSSGRAFPDKTHQRDLTNVPEPKRTGTVWTVIYEVESCLQSPYQLLACSSITEEGIDAVCSALKDRGVKILARLQKDWTEGEGLEKESGQP